MCQEMMKGKQHPGEKTQNSLMRWRAVGTHEGATVGDAETSTSVHWRQANIFNDNDKKGLNQRYQMYQIKRMSLSQCFLIIQMWLVVQLQARS